MGDYFLARTVNTCLNDIRTEVVTVHRFRRKSMSGEVEPGQDGEQQGHTGSAERKQIRGGEKEREDTSWSLSSK